MKIKLLSFVLLNLIFLLVACAPSLEFKKFKSETGNFSTRIPASIELLETTQSVPTGDPKIGALQIHSFDGAVNQIIYTIFYFDFPKGYADDPASWAPVLDGAREGWLQAASGKLQAQESQISLGNYLGREAIVDAKSDSGQDVTIKARYYLVKNRIYQIMVSVPKGQAISPQMDDFLKSFALLVEDLPESTEAAVTVGSSQTPAHTGSEETGPQPKSPFGQIQVRNIVNTGGRFIRIDQDPVGGEIYYMDHQVNIYRLMLQPGAASTGWKMYSATDVGEISTSLGMTFGPDGSLYVLGNEATQDTTRAIIRKGVPNGSGQRTWSTLVSTEAYPLSKNAFDHVYSGLVVSPDGKYLFIAAGSRTDHGEVETGEGAFPDTREMPLTSAIFRIPTDSQNLVLPNNEAGLKPYLFADGLRNAFDLAFDANGELFAIDNGPDADFPDELNWIQQGNHYGFPWRFGNEDNPQQFPDFEVAQDRRIPREDAYHNDPGFPPPPMKFTDPVANLGPDGAYSKNKLGKISNAPEPGQPLYGFTPHRSPLGLVFDTKGAIPGLFKGDAFLLSWGASLSNFPDRGQDLLDLKLTKVEDHYQVTTTQIMTGFNNPIDAVLFGDKLYVLEYGGQGGIWEITFPE